MYKKIICIGVLLLMSVSLFGGCKAEPVNGEDGPGFSNGFTGNGGPQTSDRCGFKSNTDVFDVNDVSFYVYIGMYRSPLTPVRIVTDWSTVVGVFNSRNGSPKKYDELVVLKEIKDYSSDLFDYTETKTGKKTYRIDYNYSVLITVPSEIFSEKTSSFAVGFFGISLTNNPEKEIGGGMWTEFIYTLEDGTVTLSPKEFQ